MDYTIYQIKDIENCNYIFRGYDSAKFNLDDYYEVYHGRMSNSISKDATDLLEDIFRYFNRVTDADVERLNRIGFVGHSLSCSDLVRLDGKLYYCDTCGWTLIEEEK